MSNLARELDTKITQEYGTVLRRDGDLFVVRAPTGDLRARRAASCLVEPGEGDLVLAATGAGGHAFVLAVLERDAKRPTRLIADGELSLEPTGKLTLAASAVEVVARESLAFIAAKVAVKALEAGVVVDSLQLVGRTLESELERIKSFAKSFDSVLERFTQRTKRSYRTVTEADHVRAEQIDYVARRTMNLHGENAIVTAEELVKVDGAQIHVG